MLFSLKRIASSRLVRFWLEASVPDSFYVML